MLRVDRWRQAADVREADAVYRHGHLTRMTIWAILSGVWGLAALLSWLSGMLLLVELYAWTYGGFVVLIGLSALYQYYHRWQVHQRYLRERGHGPVEFVLGHHPRVGGASPVYCAFRSSPLYAPKLTQMILSFATQEVTPVREGDAVLDAIV